MEISDLLVGETTFKVSKIGFRNNMRTDKIGYMNEFKVKHWPSPWQKYSRRRRRYFRLKFFFRRKIARQGTGMAYILR